jgi:hypothetical protein
MRILDRMSRLFAFAVGSTFAVTMIVGLVLVIANCLEHDTPRYLAGAVIALILMGLIIQGFSKTAINWRDDWHDQVLKEQDPQFLHKNLEDDYDARNV